MKRVVFTDLDGTFLDRDTYSYQESVAGVERLKEEGIPLVFCSAKTRAEQEVYRRRLEVFHPFIVENGGAIFIPRDYFPFPFDYHKRLAEFLVIELGISYQEIRRLLDRVRKEGGFRFRGFGDMTAEEVAEVSGLDVESARRAKKREYEETIVIASPSPPVILRARSDRRISLRANSAEQSRITSDELDKFLEKIGEVGLNWMHGGRFYGVMGDNDKGKAVKILTGLYRWMWGEVETIGLGDSLNDLPMLAAVDIPVLVQKKDHTWENVDLPVLRRIPGVGPEGWSRAINGIFGG